MHSHQTCLSNAVYATMFLSVLFILDKFQYFLLSRVLYTLSHIYMSLCSVLLDSLSADACCCPCCHACMLHQPVLYQKDRQPMFWCFSASCCPQLEQLQQPCQALPVLSLLRCTLQRSATPLQRSGTPLKSSEIPVAQTGKLCCRCSSGKQKSGCGRYPSNALLSSLVRGGQGGAGSDSPPSNHHCNHGCSPCRRLRLL